MSTNLRYRINEYEMALSLLDRGVSPHESTSRSFNWLLLQNCINDVLDRRAASAPQRILQAINLALTQDFSIDFLSRLFKLDSQEIREGIANQYHGPSGKEPVTELGPSCQGLASESAEPATSIPHRIETQMKINESTSLDSVFSNTGYTALQQQIVIVEVMRLFKREALVAQEISEILDLSYTLTSVILDQAHFTITRGNQFIAEGDTEQEKVRRRVTYQWRILGRSIKMIANQIGISKKEVQKHIKDSLWLRVNHADDSDSPAVDIEVRSSTPLADEGHQQGTELGDQLVDNERKFVPIPIDEYQLFLAVKEFLGSKMVFDYVATLFLKTDARNIGNKAPLSESPKPESQRNQ